MRSPRGHLAVWTIAVLASTAVTLGGLLLGEPVSPVLLWPGIVVGEVVASIFPRLGDERGSFLGLALLCNWIVLIGVTLVIASWWKSRRAKQS